MQGPFCEDKRVGTSLPHRKSEIVKGRTALYVGEKKGGLQKNTVVAADSADK